MGSPPARCRCTPQVGVRDALPPPPPRAAHFTGRVKRTLYLPSGRVCDGMGSTPFSAALPWYACMSQSRLQWGGCEPGMMGANLSLSREHTLAHTPGTLPIHPPTQPLLCRALCHLQATCCRAQKALRLSSQCSPPTAAAPRATCACSDSPSRSTPWTGRCAAAAVRPSQGAVAPVCGSNWLGAPQLAHPQPCCLAPCSRAPCRQLGSG